MSVKEFVKNTAKEVGLMESQNDDNKPYKPAVLKKYHDRWIILFSAFDHKTGRLKSKQVRVPSTLPSAKRNAWAKERIDAINRLLAIGYSFNPKRPKGQPISQEPPKSVRQAFGMVLELIEAGMREETSKSYRTCFKAFLEWAKANKADELPIGSLATHHTAAYLDAIVIAGKSNYTHNGHLAMLRATANKLIERGIIEADFTKGLKQRKVEQAHNTPFTAEEMEILKAWMLKNNRPLWLICKMIYYSFIRPIELTRLKVGDIDLQQGHIRCASATSKNKKLEFVPISKQLRVALEEYGVGKLEPSFYLFGDGSRLLPSRKPTIRPRMSDAHLEAMKACELEGRDKSLYTWKDTGAVNAYKAGIDIKTLQSLLRHHSVAMTEIYLRGLGQLVSQNIEGKEW